MLLDSIVGEACPCGEVVVGQCREQRALGWAEEALVQEFDDGRLGGHLVDIVGSLDGWLSGLFNGFGSGVLGER